MAKRVEDDFELTRQLIVEFIGTFALMFFGGGAIIVTAAEGLGANAGLLVVALAHGLAIGLMVAAAGHISGGLYNPALTVGLMVTGRMPSVRGVAYIVTQCVGSLIAALALKAIFDASQIDAVKLGVPLVGARYEVTAALLAEIIATFFLMYAVFGTAVDPRGAKSIAGLVIGLTITIGVLAIGPVSGAALNPARAIGPEIAQGEFGDFWIYWVGPIGGAALAALLYNYILMPGAITPEAGRVESEPTEAHNIERESRSQPRPQQRRRKR
ncbi:MAG TPA: aquaporin [Thermomicrobiales bacterium]|nr:aquaporin [Thermomicrobiales bacterium]